MNPSKLLVVSFLGACGAACGASDVPPPKEPDAAPPPAAAEPEHPSPKTATLVIESSPPGMPALLNGKPVGKTPVTVDKLAPGNYDVTIKDEANGDVTMPVELGEGEYKTQKFNVTPRADRPPPSNAKN